MTELCPNGASSEDEPEHGNDYRDEPASQPNGVAHCPLRRDSGFTFD